MRGAWCVVCWCAGVLVLLHAVSCDAVSRLDCRRMLQVFAARPDHEHVVYILVKPGKYHISAPQ